MTPNKRQTDPISGRALIDIPAEIIGQICSLLDSGRQNIYNADLRHLTFLDKTWREEADRMIFRRAEIIEWEDIDTWTEICLGWQEARAESYPKVLQLRGIRGERVEEILDLPNIHRNVQTLMLENVPGSSVNRIWHDIPNFRKLTKIRVALTVSQWRDCVDAIQAFARDGLLEGLAVSGPPRGLVEPGTLSDANEGVSVGKLVIPWKFDLQWDHSLLTLRRFKSSALTHLAISLKTESDAKEIRELLKGAVNLKTLVLDFYQTSIPRSLKWPAVAGLDTLIWRGFAEVTVGQITSPMLKHLHNALSELACLHLTRLAVVVYDACCKIGLDEEGMMVRDRYAALEMEIDAWRKVMLVWCDRLKDLKELKLGYIRDGWAGWDDSLWKRHEQEMRRSLSCLDVSCVVSFSVEMYSDAPAPRERAVGDLFYDWSVW